MGKIIDFAALQKFVVKFYSDLDGRLILLLTFLNLPNALTTLFVVKSDFTVIRHTIFYIFYAFALAVLIAAIILGVKKISLTAAKFLKYLLLTVYTLIFLTDIFTITHYGTVLNHTMLRIILGTHPKEASDFFTNYVLDPHFLATCFFMLIILFILCRIKIPHYKEKFVAIFLILSTFIFLTRTIQNPRRVFEKGSSIARVAILLPKVFQDIQEYKELFLSAGNNITLTRNESDLPLVIFILGEATTRNHMQLYGYHLPTNPNLAERNARGELKIFTDTISPNSYTMAAMQKIFTFMRNDNDSEGEVSDMSKGNLISILNAAGYYTAWLSNKEMGGLFGNMNRLYSEASTSAKFTQYRDDSESNNKLDEQLLPFLDEELQHEHEKAFYVLHLMGAHNDYRSRYPHEFEKFSAKDENNPRKEVRQTCAEYDNALLYNDFIVNEIIKRVEELDSIVVYIPDHGEDVFEEREFADHVEEALSTPMIEIPFIIWTSTKFKSLHAELENKITAAVDKPFMTDDMIHLILDMLKIETADFDATLSPINENYNSARVRIVGEGKIYTKVAGIH